MRGYWPWALGIGELLALVVARELFGFGNAIWDDLFMTGVFWTLLCALVALAVFTLRTFRLARPEAGDPPTELPGRRVSELSSSRHPSLRRDW